MTTTIKKLKEKFELGLESICKSGSHELKKDLTIGDLAKFKEVLTAINNILVIAQTCAFADEIDVQQIKEIIENPNKNGFDIEYSEGNIKILAELKATVPCGKNKKYGANQKKSILGDLKNLSDKSKKSERLGIDLANYDKYIVLLKGQEDAMKSMDRYAKEQGIKIKYIDTEIKINKYENFGWND